MLKTSCKFIMNFSKENLIKFLGDLKIAVESDQISETTQQHIWELLTCSNENDPSYKEMIKYLFTGWWIHTQLK